MLPSDAGDPRPPSPRLLLGLGLLASYAVLIVRSAWVSDDAFITLRTVANFVDGEGLRWNVAERVQSYTHPLWMLCLSAVFALVRDPYFSALGLSLGVSMVAMVGLWRLSVDPLRAAALGTLAMLTKSFVDYSTSGLENPLTHALLALFVGLALHRPERLSWLAGAAALLATNRLDTLLLALPVLALHSLDCARRDGLRHAVRELALGASPLLAWLAFALFYYGFPFPNTAYAKLHLGIPHGALMQQGLVYLLNTVSWDPWLALALVGTTAAALLTRQRLCVGLALGALLYVAYVVRVGGDFMAGRFLTAPLFASLLACAIAPGARLGTRELASFVVPASALLFSVVGTEKWPVVHDLQMSGVADERIFYRECMSLMSFTRTGPLPCRGMVERSLPLYRGGAPVSVVYNVGVAGYYVPRAHHIIDPFALTDALLARLPVTDPTNFRVGHYGRTVPKGYLETVRDGTCKLESRALCRYYEKLQLVVAGPLWSGARLGAIAGFLFGRYDDARDDYLRGL